MRAVFLGSPEEAVPSLDALSEVAEVPLVVTQPDRPRGRSRRPVPPAVKVAAQQRNLAVAQPDNRAGLRAALAESAPLDVAVLTAYGRLVPEDVLSLPAAGFVNVHFSLLPRWRGASPVVRAILAGDTTTGVTLMKMDEGLDTGPTIAAASTAIRPGESAGDLTMRLAQMGATLIKSRLSQFVAGELEALPQEDSGATAAAKVTSEEAHLDPIRHGAEAVERAVRAFDPRPGAWMFVDGERFKVWAARPAPESVEPGVVTKEGDRVLLGCRDGAVELLVVQPSGKRRMEAVAWMRGRRDEPVRVTG